MRLLAIVFAATLPLAAPAAGRVTTICTAQGLRLVRVDADGAPLPARREPRGCAHLWCDTSRTRPRARPDA